MQRPSLRSKGSRPHTGLPRPMYREDKLPEHLALKPSAAPVWENQRTVGNRDSALKGHTSNSGAPSPSAEAVTQKEPIRPA